MSLDWHSEVCLTLQCLLVQHTELKVNMRVYQLIYTLADVMLSICIMSEISLWVEEIEICFLIGDKNIAFYISCYIICLWTCSYTMTAFVECGITGKHGQRILWQHKGVGVTITPPIFRLWQACLFMQSQRWDHVWEPIWCSRSLRFGALCYQCFP